MTTIISTIASEVAPAGIMPVHENMRTKRRACLAQDKPRTVNTMASAPALRSTEIS
jgi:hypothetical protein